METVKCLQERHINRPGLPPLHQINGNNICLDLCIYNPCMLCHVTRSHVNAVMNIGPCCFCSCSCLAELCPALPCVCSWLDTEQTQHCLSKACVHSAGVTACWGRLGHASGCAEMQNYRHYYVTCFLQSQVDRS